MLKEIWITLSKRRQRQFLLLLLLMLLASLSEVISVGAIVPFLGVITAPEQIYNHHFMQPVVRLLDLKEPNQLVLPLTVAFMCAALFAGTIRLVLLYAMTRLSFATGADLSINIYQRTLYQDYSVHVERNSSEIINGIITKSSVVIHNILLPTLMLISSIILLFGITGILFVIDIKIALTASITFGLLYWLVVQYTRQKLKDNSRCIAEQSTFMIKSLQEGLGGIRDVLIDGSQKFYCNIYRKADLPFRKASGNNLFISGSPRFAMEAIGMTLIAGLAYTKIQEEGSITTAIPILGALALGAQRLLPALQQAYAAYSSIKGANSSFKDVLNLLRQPLPDYAELSSSHPIVFDKIIKLNNLSYKYTNEGPWVLKNINLNLLKGECIGFMGVTGSGKSTLIDIIMGLLNPTSGGVDIDEQLLTTENKRTWQAHIAHVPQMIFLSDSTIKENIAFGISKERIDQQRVEKAAQQAQISELIEEWKDGYDTIVGERGLRLSGGQRQRIGIARALYKQANVLIFDEATSSLDNDTEQAVMEAIEGQDRDLTILIIAHRLSTLRNCDQIIKLGKNNNFTVGSYQDLINT
jgi:ATP-binding cassette, subfamily B, bacterial PglK